MIEVRLRSTAGEFQGFFPLVANHRGVSTALSSAWSPSTLWGDDARAER